MKDPFEAAAEEQDSPPESPVAEAEEEFTPAFGPDDDVAGGAAQPSTSVAVPQRGAGASGTGAAAATAGARGKEDEEEEDEEHMEVDLDKLPPGGDPDKLAKMQAILSQFTEGQMNRYESFRRSGFQKSNMKRLLANIIGTQKISIPTNIVVSGIAKMFVGELIETARIVMTERRESGPIRPCHIRESYRRLKLEGKIPRRYIPRLFR